MKNKEKFKPTHEVVLEDWCHKFKIGEKVMITGEFGECSGEPFYKNKGGITQVLAENEVKQLKTQTP